MDIKGWKYYNCAAIPTTDPNEQSDTTPIDNGNIWKIRGGYSAVGKMDNGL